MGEDRLIPEVVDVPPVVAMETVVTSRSTAGLDSGERRDRGVRCYQVEVVAAERSRSPVCEEHSSKYLTRGDNVTKYLVHGENTRKYLTDGDSTSKYLTHGDSTSKYLAHCVHGGGRVCSVSPGCVTTVHMRSSSNVEVQQLYPDPRLELDQLRMRNLEDGTVTVSLV